MASSEELLQALLATCEEQLRWQKATATPLVRQVIDQALTTQQTRRAYELCDGTVTGADIAAAVGVTKQSVSNWTQKWRELGIAYEVDGRRIKHLVSLDALGLPSEP